MRKWVQSTGVLITVLCIIWGLSFSVYKVALTESPPWLFAGLRTFAGGLFILPIALRRRSAFRLRQTWHIYLISCLLNVLFFFGMQTVGLTLLPAGLFSVLVYLEPVLVGLFAWLWIGESMSPLKVIGLLLGFAGVATISANSFSTHLSAVGVVIGILTALAWAFGTIYTKHVQGKVDLFWLLTAQFLFGGVVMTAIGSVTESWSAITWGVPFWFGVIYAGLFGIGLSWIIWFKLVHEGEATRIAAFTFFVPLISVATSVIFLGEPFTASLVVSLLLIVAGIYLVNRSPRKVAPPSVEAPCTASQPHDPVEKHTFS